MSGTVTKAQAPTPWSTSRAFAAVGAFFGRLLARQPQPDRTLVAAVKGDPAVASVWRGGGNVMTEPAITLELRAGRRVVHTRLSVSLLAAALLATLPAEPEPDDLLARLHRPNAPGPGGEQR
jgi:hypothetical protein